MKKRTTEEERIRLYIEHLNQVQIRNNEYFKELRKQRQVKNDTAIYEELIKKKKKP